MHFYCNLCIFVHARLSPFQEKSFSFHFHIGLAEPESASTMAEIPLVVHVRSSAKGDLAENAITGEILMLEGHSPSSWSLGSSPDGDFLTAGDASSDGIWLEFDTIAMKSDLKDEVDGRAGGKDIYLVHEDGSTTWLADVSQKNMMKIVEVATLPLPISLATDEFVIPLEGGARRVWKLNTLQAICINF